MTRTQALWARSLVGAALCAISATAAVQTANAASIVNGSFESPIVPVGWYTNYLAGSTQITGWTVVGVDSAVTSGSFMQSGITFEAQEGAQWLDLAGVTSNSKLSGVTQSVATVGGNAYELSFYVGSATDGSVFFPTTVDLSIDGGPRVSYSNPAARRDSLNWLQFSVPFVATSALTSITFYNGDEANNYNTSLDNVALTDVSVTPVPEPSEFALMAIGLAAIGAAGRKRSRAGKA